MKPCRSRANEHLKWTAPEIHEHGPLSVEINKESNCPRFFRKGKRKLLALKASMQTKIAAREIGPTQLT